MFQLRRSVRTLRGFLLQSAKVNKIAPQPYSVFSFSRIFASQNTDESEGADIEINRDVSIKKRSRAVKETLTLGLQDIYECSQEEIDKMALKAPPILLHTNHGIIVSNAKCLKEHGLSKSALISHPWVLGYNEQLFPTALKLLKTFHPDLNISIALLAIPFKQLLQLTSDDEKSKIALLSELLKCDQVTLTWILIKRKSVLRLPQERILKVFSTLKDGGVASEDIVKDIGIFHNNVEVMEQRLAIAKENSVTLKPWSLRCSVKVFERTVERKVKMREILGDHETVKHYLASRLNCEEALLSSIMLKIPQLKHMSVLKVKDLLDYLFEVGYSPLDVLLTFRILTRSKKTVETRVEELCRLGLKHPNLLVICKTSKEYKRLVTRMKLDW